MIDYLGLKHEYGKLDCVTLLQLFYANELGILLDIPNYSFSRRWVLEFSADNIDAWISKYATKVSLTTAKNYDLMVFRAGNVINHFAMFIQPCKILHVEENTTSKLELLSDYWVNSLHAVYRHNSLV